MMPPKEGAIDEVPSAPLIDSYETARITAHRSVDTTLEAASAPAMSTYAIASEETRDIETGLPLAAAVSGGVVIYDAQVFVPFSERYNNYFDNNNSLYDAIYVSDFESSVQNLNNNFSVRSFTRPPQTQEYNRRDQEPRQHIFTENDKKNPILFLVKCVLIVVFIPFYLVYNGSICFCKSLCSCLESTISCLQYYCAFLGEFICYVLLRTSLCVYYSICIPLYKVGVMAYRLIKYPLYYLGLALTSFVDTIIFVCYNIGCAIHTYILTPCHNAIVWICHLTHVCISAIARFVYDYMMKPVYDAVVYVGRAVYNGISAIARFVYDYMMKPAYDVIAYIATTTSFILSQLYENIVRPIGSAISIAFHAIADIIRSIGHIIADIFRSIGHIMADIFRSIGAMFRTR